MAQRATASCHKGGGVKIGKPRQVDDTPTVANGGTGHQTAPRVVKKLDSGL